MSKELYYLEDGSMDNFVQRGNSASIFIDSLLPKLIMFSLNPFFKLIFYQIYVLILVISLQYKENDYILILDCKLNFK